MANYLVTGGAGFIGSHLCDALLALGHHVTVLDDLSTGKRSNLPTQVQLHVGDIRDRALLEPLVHAADGCFHLAAIASVTRSCEAWFDTHQVNLSATVLIFNAARTNGCPVVYASSAATYGNNPNIPLLETERAAPLSPYGADKAGMELHAAAAAASFGIGSTGLRFFNVFGPRQDPSSPYSGVISIFAQRIAAGQDITIFGDGEQTRDFIYVADVVEFLIRAMNTTQAGTARVANVCTGQRNNLLQLAQALQSVYQQDVQLHFLAARDGDIKHSGGNPDYAAQLFDYRATVALQDGLHRMAQAAA